MHRSLSRLIAVRLVALFVLVSTAVCGVWLALSLTACDDEPSVILVRFPRDAGADASTDLDAGTDAEAGAVNSDVCPPGRCVGVPTPWKGPSWVWIGTNQDPYGEDGGPPCPYDMPGDPLWIGAGGDIVTPPCEPCSCLPSEGSCSLPSTLTASTAPGCTGGQAISFNAPNGWDGGCDRTNPIDADAGIKSLSIAPITKGKESCDVGPKVPAKRKPPTAYFPLFAKSCHGREWYQRCSDPINLFCAANVKPPRDGFHLCVSQTGEHECDDPARRFTENYIFYAPKITDTRECTDCTCGEPTGSMCTSMLSVYSDNACEGPVVYGQAPLSSEDPQCLLLLPPERPLGSKSATPPIYLPGTCQPMGGELIDGGTAEGTKPMSFCCLP